MPISLEDLLGARTEVEIVTARVGKLEDRDCLILTATLEGEEYRYGILPDVIDKVLAAGRKTAEGKVMLKLPAPNKEARITWVTAY